MKTKKKTKKIIELENNWNNLNQEWDKLQKFSRCSLSKIPVQTVKTNKREGSDLSHIKSLQTIGDTSVVKKTKVYTGTSMIGIATMHKSNAVPVFSSDEATNISNMRR